MAQSANFTWPQGEDLSVDLIYKEGTTALDAVVVPLSTGYEVRMDIVDSEERIYTFNSATLADVDPLTAGAQPDNVVEGVLSSGAGGTPNIRITVPRSLTLPGGAIYDSNNSVFQYDVFLRNTATNKQVKILKGSITVEESHTLWL
jgi:hypothetical protein